MTVEYGDAINDAAADRAFRIAVQRHARDGGDLRRIATAAVADAYCVCVTDGEDAAEFQFSKIHADLIERLTARLAAYLGERNDGA